MRTTFLLILVSFSVLAQSINTKNEDDQSIQQIILDQQNGWNNGDANEYSQSFSEEGMFTIITGTNFYTRSSLEERVAFILSGFFKNSTLTQKIIKIDYAADNIAIVDIETEMTGYRGLPPGVKGSADGKLRTSMLQVLKKLNDKWKVIAFHNVDVKVP